MVHGPCFLLESHCQRGSLVLSARNFPLDFLGFLRIPLNCTCQRRILQNVDSWNLYSCWCWAGGSRALSGQVTTSAGFLCHHWVFLLLSLVCGSWNSLSLMPKSLLIWSSNGISFILGLNWEVAAISGNASWPLWWAVTQQQQQLLHKREKNGLLFLPAAANIFY